MDNRGTIISIYSIVLRSQITSHCCTSRFSCLWRPIHDVCNPWWRGPLCLHLFWSRPWLFSPLTTYSWRHTTWKPMVTWSFVSVSTRVPAKHVHAGDKHTSLATNMEYYDMCGAAYDVSFLSIDTNARNCRCLCGLRIITKTDSQASSARRSSVSIAQPPLGMTPWSFEYWRLALDFGKNVHIWRNMCKYGGICAKNGKIVQTRCKNGWNGWNNLICSIYIFAPKFEGFDF